MMIMMMTRLIDETETGTTTTARNGVGSNDKEGGSPNFQSLTGTNNYM